MDRLQKYIDLVVGTGVGIKKGQKLLIWCPVDSACFARLAMSAAYKAGAENVVVRWIDDSADQISRRFSKQAFDKESELEAARFARFETEQYKMLWIYNADLESGGAEQRAVPSLRRICVPVPTLAWAKKVFPSAAEGDAINLMWDALFTACRIDRKSDSARQWQRHLDSLQTKAAVLKKHNFKYLRFENSLGTDLEIELPAEHVWLVCGGKDKQGEYYITNIPTEEVFTTPLRTGVNGVVYGSAPMFFMGGTIEGFWLRFKNGKVTEYGAKKNCKLLEKMLTGYENADYLGEVALVPHSAPISQSGLFWHDTSFDENAACHLALGCGYPTVEGAYSKTKEELFRMGINQSEIHQDFMIGSADMSITGVSFDGKETKIFIDGEWNI